MSKAKSRVPARKNAPEPYETVLADISALLEQARRLIARSVNAVMTATYWEIGRRIVELEQGGRQKAKYGAQVIERMAQDLTARFGRGFARSNLFQMRAFYQAYSETHLLEDRNTGGTSRQKVQTLSGQFDIEIVAQRFPLSWSHYVRLLSVRSEAGRAFYETEALRGGWTIRQLKRQIGSQFYERTALSRNKAAMLTKGSYKKTEDKITADEEIKDPFILEFLNLKDEYSETDLEEALIRHLEHFLLELGNDFTFVGRQRRLRVGDTWFRIDLLFYHRRLRSLIIIDLKLKEFSHADVGQMNLYLNYAREHWTHPDENPPVGLILCAEQNASVVRYALGGLHNKVLTAEYRTMLPEADTIAAEMERTRKFLEARKTAKPK